MDINDVRRERAAAEAQIRRVLDDFKEKTGMHIVEVNVENTRVRMCGSERQSIVGQQVIAEVERI